MLRNVSILVLMLTSLVIARDGFAQSAKAEDHFELAVSAKQSGQYDAALQHLERAYVADPKPQYIHQRILVLEKMGEHQLALEVLEGYRDALVASPEVNNLAVLEQRLRQEQDDVEPPPQTDGADVVGWTLTGGGAALAAGGVISFLVAEDEAERLRCSAASSAEKSGCSSVDAYTGLTPEEFDSRRGDVTLYRGLGVGLSSVGAVALGWGIYRLVDSEAPAHADAADERSGLYATVSPRGRIGVGLRLRF